MQIGVFTIGMLQMTANKYLFDTCVFIRHLRFNLPAATLWIERNERDQVHASVSALTLFEVLKGANTDQKKRDYKILFSNYSIIPVSKQIATRAAELYRSIPPQTRSNSFNIDVVIAATAEYLHCDLVTENTKDFSLFSLKKIRIISF